MDTLTKTQCWNWPLDLIRADNRKWRDLIILHDKDCPKNNDDIDKYIVKNYPELEYQFRWDAMDNNQRLAEKFHHRTRQSVIGNYRESRYDPDLDPFYD